MQSILISIAAKIISQLDSIIHTTKQFRLRSLIGREKKLVELGNAYGEKLTQDELDDIEDQIIENEYIRSNIVLMVENEPKTVEEMAENIGIPTEKVFQHVARLWKKQIILPSGHREDSPIYLKAGGS